MQKVFVKSKKPMPSFHPSDLNIDLDTVHRGESALMAHVLELAKRQESCALHVL